MRRVGELRAAAQKLYEEAAKITQGDERLAVIFRAMELETQADALEQRQPGPDDPHD